LSSDPQFEHIYKKFHPSLMSFAVYLTRNKSVASELVNDVFLAIWHKRDEFTFDDELKPYIFQALKNKCFNYNRKKQLSTVELLKSDKKSDYNADTPTIVRETKQQLDAILNSLPPKCKQIFMMSRIDEMKNKDIADLLDISIKTVENQMTKALKIFKENFKTT
jgi:RNA polymerase sigma-70 factor (ECF subfamily)